MKRSTVLLVVLVSGIAAAVGGVFSVLAKPQAAKKKTPYDPTAAALADIANRGVGKHDWPQWPNR